MFDAETYSKNQDRLSIYEVVDVVFADGVALAKRHGSVTDAHFSVNGTMVESWGLTSFRLRGDSGPNDGDG